MTWYLKQASGLLWGAPRTPEARCTYAGYSKAEYFFQKKISLPHTFAKTTFLQTTIQYNTIHRRLNTARARLAFVEFQYSTCKTSPPNFNTARLPPRQLTCRFAAWLRATRSPSGQARFACFFLLLPKLRFYNNYSIQKKLKLW